MSETKQQDAERDLKEEMSRMAREMVSALPGVRAARRKYVARLIATRRGRLQAFLRHANATVPFYRELFAGRGPGTELRDYAVIDRATLAQAGPSFVSTVFAASELQSGTTSGTTGIPIRVFRDAASAYEIYFDTHRRLGKRLEGFRRGLQAGRCAVLVVMDNPQKKVGGTLNPSLKNAVTFWRHATLDPRELEGWCERSGDGRLEIPILSCRPKAGLALLETHGFQKWLKPGAILCSGDNLYPEVRRQLEEGFGCRVYNGYGSREGGFMAIDCRFQQGLHVYGDRAVLEVQSESGDLSSEGSGELVVTNLENWAMPLIRYKNRDMGTVRRVKCACGFVGQSLVELQGRDAVYFSVNGKKFSPSILDYIFEQAGVFEYHVVQTGPDSFDVDYALNLQGATDAAMDDRLGRGMAAELPSASIRIVRGGYGREAHLKRPRYSISPEAFGPENPARRS